MANSRASRLILPGTHHEHPAPKPRAWSNLITDERCGMVF
jgi:hypothetical protein